MEIERRGTINAPADQVWESVKDFGTIHVWSAVKSATVVGEGEGAVRNIELPDGNFIDERLETLDEENRRLEYSILTERVPYKDYLGVMEVVDLGNETCEVIWSCTCEPTIPEKAAERNMGGFYEAGIAGLKRLHEGEITPADRNEPFHSE
ncbi:MAG: SRPBCC family protein [Candidatus Promineifilaceae bacterium]|nr:SRPBCC family protein [Candidatus Promineifilaceae bacterium]